MQNRMQTVIPKRGMEIIHVETELGVVNIHIGLHDRIGRTVETVFMLPRRYVGEQKVVVRGGRFVELKRKLRAT